MKKVAMLLALVLLLVACGDDGGEVPSVDDESPIDPSRQAAIEVGLTEEQFVEYRSDLDLVLSDLRDYWSVALPELYGIEHISPSAFIDYRSAEDAPTCGGQQVEAGNAFYCVPENYIAWDEAGLLMPYFAQVGDFAIAYVLAHEWGHAIQKQVGAQAEAGIFFELQADCYAGAWGADADLRGMLEPGDVEEGLAAVRSVGDLPGVPWFDPQAHGTPEQRIEAFAAGFRRGPFACTELTS
jgi:predicted metalloprotease